MIWLLLLALDPFWVTKPVQDWTDLQIASLLSDSPWGTMAEDTAGGTLGAVRVSLSSAKPIRLAEQELLRRSSGELDPELEDLLNQKVLIVAVPVAKLEIFAQSRETKAMEDESFMVVGKKKIKPAGHLPPTPTDPTVRLVFPRPDLAGVKELRFELYLPGVPGNYRNARFYPRDMVFKGELTY